MSKAESDSKSLKRNQTSSDADGVVAGVHLSGANARKSAVVLLEIRKLEASFISVYEKIGSSGSLFSDDRILNILKNETRLLDVFVDCPLTDPPCVSCVQPVCPGVVRCDDVSVAMMLALESQRGRKGAHKLRPLNPQQQRLWDIMYARGGAFGNLEPSYSANLAPLVVRARTLQRRLRSLFPDLKLRETNVPIVLSQLCLALEGDHWEQGYRNFEKGSAVRREILKRLIESSNLPLRIRVSKDAFDQISTSVEAFHAFVAAAMGVWRSRGLARAPSRFFESEPGWVEVMEPNTIR